LAKSPASTPTVQPYTHDDRRVMNPEVGLVKPSNDPDSTKTKWAYDPHLDPALQFDIGRAQVEALIDGALASSDADTMREALAELRQLQQPYLNWSGKAERTAFEVDTVSLHVHERIDPATILEAVKKRMADGSGMAEVQGDFFAPKFEEKPLREALGFYKHDKDWSNRLISGDSLLVMNSLLQKESMRGKVQMIYIDPPYGIKYGSNFQPFTNKRDVKDRADEDLTQEPEMIKAFRDTWELGIHSYLTYLRDRLMLARELLTDSGSIFVQISDDNIHHVRELLDELFGQSNFISIVTVRKTGAVSSPDARVNSLATIGDYLVWYARDKPKLKYNQLFSDKTETGTADAQYRLSDTNGAFQSVALESNGASEAFSFPVPMDGKTFYSASNRHWSTTYGGVLRTDKAGRVLRTENKLRFKKYLSDFPVSPIANIWTDLMGASGLMYVVQTNDKVLDRCVLMTTDPGDLVLDPTCGSGTTAYVAEKWGRRWITCDTSRVAVTLAKQRLMTASFDYYALRFPNEGVRGGFDYKTVPHVTLKSIANNPDIDTIYDEEHPKIEAALSTLNAALLAAKPNALPATQGVRKGKKIDFKKGETLHEWEVPFDLPTDWPEALKTPFDAFHSARRVMQRRMDLSIADNAEPETLYDQPKIDPTKLRVTGKFTVEAVPAPVVMGLDDDLPGTEPDASIARSGGTSKQAMWRDELIKTGIRGKGGAMLRLADLEVIPGTKVLHASGSLADTGERVVVSFGPEHAALEQRQVELAVQEADKLVPKVKMVVFCAFTFDPEAAKDIDEIEWPGVTLLKVQMNTDLLTEDLKKKRASNQSFWLMGQPDVDLRKRPDGKWEVEVNGFDYFNPKTGELDSGGKNKIAMWSLDTDYNQRSLFPRQVFFPMAGDKEGWMRLKATLRAQLDEDALGQFRGTVSLPFEAGDHKRVAVKIVDDRGIESLKIIALDA
jgi:adenine-specific DNA-methyltransferase